MNGWQIVNRIKRAFQLLRSPGFWVCIWEGKSERHDMEQHGRFAAMGKTRQDAEVDALEQIKQRMWFEGDVEYRVRRPLPWEIRL